MSARPYDHVLRYLVRSESRPDVEHLVEIDSFGGNGKCTCERFMFQCEPALKAGRESHDDLRCHHIKEAREAFLDKIILAMIESGDNRKPKTKP